MQVRYWSRAALLIAAMAFSASAVSLERSTATAESVAAKRRYDIPAGPLAAALNRYADETSLALVYPAALANGLRTGGVSGDFTAAEALERLLAGTGLAYRFTDGKTVTIQKQESNTRVLGPVRVQGAEPTAPARGESVAQLGGIRGGQDQETRGLRPVVASVGTPAPTALEDIPRSISVLTREQMEKQNITDIGEALKRLPGVTLIESSTNTSTVGPPIVSRGFRIQKMQVDGGVAQDLNILGNGLFDLSAYERVELVRGPNGAFIGDGSPGGTINLVRKRPGMAQSLQVTATAGSWNRRELGLDYSTPSIAGTPLAFRGVATYQDQEYFYDNSDRRNWSLYAILDAPLGENARVELGADMQDVFETGGYVGLPRYIEGPLLDIPRSANIATRDAYNDIVTKNVFGRLLMSLPHRWNLQAGVSYQTSDIRSVAFNSSPVLLRDTKTAPPGWAMPLWLREHADELNSLGMDVTITGRAHFLGIDHNLSLRGDFRENSSPAGRRERDWHGPIVYQTLAEVYPVNFPQAEFPAFASSSSRVSSSTAGLLLADTLSWRDLIDLNLSLRRTQQKGERSFGIRRENYPLDPLYGQITALGYYPPQSADEARWEPDWSLVLKPLPGLSIYGDLSNGSQPQDTFYTPSGVPLGPLKYDNKEIGIKYGRSNWLASLSAYDTFKSNVAAAIPGTRGRCPPTASSVCYYLLGNSMKSKGVEFEISGELLEGLSATASYVYNKSELTPGVDDQQSEIFTQSPQRSARLFMDWRLPFLEQTSMNLSASYRSKTFQSGNRYLLDPDTGELVGVFFSEFTEPSHLVLDMGFSRAFGRSLSLDVLVENITNKEYLSTVSSWSNFVGRPRSFTVALRWRPHGAASPADASPTTGMAPFGDPARWYGSFEVGMHDAGAFTGTSSGTKLDGTKATWDHETGANALSFARIGYRLGGHWRIETEGGFRGADLGRISGSGIAPNGVCDATFSTEGRVPDCNDVPGEANAWSLMFNGLYDFGDEANRIRPFVGLGLGVTRWSIDFGGKMRGVGPDDQPWTGDAFARALDETIGAVDQSYALSWQAIAGAAFRLTDRAYITAGYTFNQSVNVKWDTFNMRQATPTLGTFKGDIVDQSVTLGLRWFFGPQP